MKRKLLISTLMLMWLIKAIGQDLPTIVPPSPEATSLAKFTEIPVSTHTGIPNISVPIYTISQSGISLPISLSYHARGVKVEEVASRVGLGWALNYGGSISRQTRGIADEHIRGYANNDIDQTFLSDPNTVPATSNRQTIIAQQINHSDLDFTPDVFFFDFNGVNGKFILDKESNEPILQEFKDIKIEYFDVEPTSYADGIGRFEVTDENGTKYYFGVSKDGLRNARNTDDTVETIRTPLNGGANSTSGSGDRYYNAWQLMDIETVNGDLIEFYYHSDLSTLYRRSYDKIENNTPVNYTSKISSYQYQLVEIRFNSGKVVFTPSNTERADLSGSYSLETIEVFDKNSNLIQKHALNYTYSNDTSNNNVLNNLLLRDPKSSKRLFLVSIEQEGTNGATLPPYNFEYSTENLPNRFSNAQDLWGYYNGKNNGEYLTFFNYDSNDIDREVDTTKAEAGMLKKITYPTGGYTNFTYEHNKVKKGFILSTTDLVLSGDPTPSTPTSDGIGYFETTFYNNVNTYTKTIDINIGPTDHTGSYNFSATEPNYQFIAYATITPSDGSTPITYQLNKTSNGALTSLKTGTITLVVEVSPNGYVPTNIMQHGSSFNLIINWNEQESSGNGGSTNIPDILYGPGKRIKKIEFNDGAGVVTTKEYEYNAPDGETSGLLFGLPNYYSINTNESINSLNTILAPFGAVPGSPLGTPQGNSIGYRYVTEYLGTKTVNSGKTEYEFTMFEDTGDYHKFPYPLPTDNAWLRGKNIRTKIFEKQGSTYFIRKEIENKYLFGNTLVNGNNYDVPIFNPQTAVYNLLNDVTNTNLLYLKNRRVFRLPLVMFSPDPFDAPPFNIPSAPSDYFYRVYYHTSGTLDLYSTKETNYLEGNELINETINFYDYDTHYFTDKTETISSDNKTVITETQYPNDVTLVSDLGYNNLSTTEEDAIDKLKTLNQLATPIQVETTIKEGNTILSTTVQRTNFYEPHTDLVLPKEVQTLKGIYNSSTNTLQDRIVYHAYDDTGNPIELSKADGTHIVYVWGYNGEYPVAKIENATKSQVDALNLNTSLINNTGTSDSDMRSELHKIRTGLSNAMVTTYTYAPLIGLTSVTDPKGYTMYYEYDPFNRLEFVKDDDDNILSENEYNYKQ